MRARRVVLLVATVVILLLVSLHRHIHELGEVIHTYTTFHELVRQHPDLFYQYPEPVVQTQTVPKIIHNIALGSSVNFTKYDAAIESCKKLHPDWEYMLWTDDNATSFLLEQQPDIIQHYMGYAQNIQRANILRYALLHHFGGVYLDIDVICHVALDTTPLVGLPLVTPGAYPAGVNNAFIAARPRHPFLAQILHSVPSHDMFWGLPMRIPYVENMMSTGCMFFSNEWMLYAHNLLAGRQEQKIYILANEKGNMDPHMLRGKVTTPIFSHMGASSWHSWDAAMLLMIGNHYFIFLFMIVFLVTTVVVLSLYFCTATGKRTWHRRNSTFFVLGGVGWSSKGKTKAEERDNV